VECAFFVAVKKRRLPCRKPWSSEEKSAVQSCLGKFFFLKRLPGKKDIDECLAKYPVLSSRSWRNVKDFLRNAQTAHAKKTELLLLFSSTRWFMTDNDHWHFCCVPVKMVELSDSMSNVSLHYCKILNLADLKIGDFTCKIILAPFILANSNHMV